jgi:hypothetical protein
MGLGILFFLPIIPLFHFFLCGLCILSCEILFFIPGGYEIFSDFLTNKKTGVELWPNASEKD